ncbi:PepSY-associated TM helix domain-containing protein [Acinetobacter larvae]|uniref:Peptidase n=1 Tax=Acinetobacter larvae TaxID=1789224 RepID=A0A1B2LXE7_9GAMM|nr:PepSY-associated TM helix domain-containing protein [Acinetobacter larvae]AOA57606.1 hypothetical protein BFG52_04040 [Acinetobacter larvae]
MRPDYKVEGPRQSMSWLHTWSSLLLGWLLYAVFVTGTLSFFQNEMTVWMKPEFHQSVAPASSQQQTAVALNYLQHHAADAASWSIQLPNSRQTTTDLSIRKAGEENNGRRGGERVILDSQTGEVLKARETRGGGFFYRFHFELYGMPVIWGRWIVGFATLLMLVAIISGVITHKKIFQDFFTFRPGKGQRSWLDAHNATAVLALPFHLMITFSGLLLLMFIFMPWGIKQAYPETMGFFQEMRGGNNNRTAQTREERPDRKAKRATPEAVAMADFMPMIQQVKAQWGDNPIRSIQVNAPNTAKASVEFRAQHANSVVMRNSTPTLQFNAVTGQLLAEQTTAQSVPVSLGIYNVFTALHEARGVDIVLRWILFLSGVLGSFMIATGLVLWCIKRAPQQFKQGYISKSYRFVEIANIGTIIGLPLAVTAYFYANRLLPIAIEMRTQWEIRCFLMTWLISFIYASFRNHRQAWLELLLITAIAYAFVPVLNILTGGAPLWRSMAQGQWMIASFDLMCLCFAVLFFWAFKQLKKHKSMFDPKNKAKAKTPVKSKAHTGETA